MSVTALSKVINPKWKTGLCCSDLNEEYSGLRNTDFFSKITQPISYLRFIWKLIYLNSPFLTVIRFSLLKEQLFVIRSHNQV